MLIPLLFNGSIKAMGHNSKSMPDKRKKKQRIKMAMTEVIVWISFPV